MIARTSHPIPPYLVRTPVGLLLPSDVIGDASGRGESLAEGGVDVGEREVLRCGREVWMLVGGIGMKV